MGTTALGPGDELTEICLTVTGAVTVIATFWLAEPNLAVRVNDPVKVPPTAKLNVAEVAPPATVTEPGAERAALLVVNPTADGDETAELRLTVQLPAPPDATVKGAQARDVSEPGINKDIVMVFESPLSDADKVALEFDKKVPAVAVKTTEEAPLEAIAAAGETWRSGLPLDTAMETVAPGGTAFVRLTVQAVEAPGNRTPLSQPIEDGATGAVNERGAVPTEPLRDAMTVML
jgi:hypothetical protein